MNTQKEQKKRLILAARDNNDNIKLNRKQQKLENKNEKTNDCMDISSDKLGRLHSRRPGNS